MKNKTNNNNQNKIKMKKLILSISAIALFTLCAFAFKGEDAPAAVKASFAKLYPNVSKVKWGKEDANYEAGFEMNKIEMSCLFDASGNLLETETEIETSALPKGVSEYVTKNYAGQKIKEAAKIVDAKNVTTYEAEVKAGDLIFDSNGNFIKKVVENDKDKDDDEKDEKK